MPEIKQQLVRLNLDDDYNYLQKGDYVDALNITSDSETTSKDITITNLVGNQLVAYTLPSGTNIPIGAKADILRNRVYEFWWNSNNYHSIILYDRSAGTRTKLIENRTDTNNVDVLQFNRYKKIIHVDIIYRDTSEGDLIFWTDGNVSPRKFNEKHIIDGDYSVIKTPFIELAKAPPLSPPVCVYGSDTTRDANSLRKKLFMFTQRFGYDDFEKTTFSTYSKIPLPIGYYGSDNDISNTSNNFITITVETGDENVTTIDIAMRSNIANAWGDFVLVASLNKEQLGLPNNSTYDYLFYNDGVYPILDFTEEVEPLFDWVPQKANAQCLPNGNVVDLGGITENYNNYPTSELDVTLTVENVTNVPPDADPPSVTYVGPTFGNIFIFTVSGTIPDGTRFTGTAFIGSLLDDIVLYDYTSAPGDTIADVVNGIFASIDPTYQNGSVSPDFYVALGSGSFIISTTVTVPVSPTQISTEKTWLWKANYIFGLVYVDEQNRDMPGVTTFSNPIDSDNDFLVTTPAFSLDGSDVQTPVISASINHEPPEGAVKYYWVRRRMTYTDVLMYITCDFQEDADFQYFCLENIEQYKEDNSQFNYGTAPITSDSRLQVLAGVTAGAYDGDIWNEDYEILGTVIKTLTGGSSPGDDKTFIKVKKPAGAISPAYKVNMLVMVYTPMSNPTSLADSVYNEWGEAYDIYTQTTLTYTGLTLVFSAGEVITGATSGATATVISDNGATSMVVEDIDGAFDIGEVITGGTSGATATLATETSTNYHRGGDQDQTAIQAAEFTFAEGDVYFHQRTMDTELLTAPYATATLNIMDENYSDFFLSAVNDNGRGQLVAENARQTYFPTLNRFSLAYQENTDINQTNRFLFINFQDYDRSFGDIFKLSIKNRYMIVGQRFKIGRVPIFNQISKDSAGNEILASTSSLLNPINYYAGDFGVGTAPASWVSYNYSDYFFDNVRGIWCRLSQDGITPISVLYKVNSWASVQAPLRTGEEFTIYGIFDSKSNYCFMALEATDDEPAYTLSFDEKTNAFKSFIYCHPKMACTLGTLLITFNEVGLWTHDSDTYNNFFGTQYGSHITPVFNEQPAIKKTFNAIGYQANQIWSSPTNGDIQTSNVNPQTGLATISNIKSVDYDLQENVYVAAFNRDANSMSDARLAAVEGDILKGIWVKTKLAVPAANADELIFLNDPYITASVSNRNF